MNNVVAWEQFPARPAREADFPAWLDPQLMGVLTRRGVDRLYVHQAQAIDAAHHGDHVVVVTPTASGKTLCYNLPVLQTCLRDPSARALYLFPTKALAQDQAAALNALMDGFEADQPRVPVHIYDGDTPASQRSAIRQQPGIMLSNPDMLHRGILPSHTKWARFFESLCYVILDELHTYRGVFGSHVANVLRRLRRICAFYGSQPVFICASATIANPRELAERLIEAPVCLVNDNGAPQREKHVILYNPPLIDPAQAIRRSYTLESKDIAGRFLANDVQTITFARARLTAEVLLGYLRDSVAADGGDPTVIRGYRGGYLPSERRAIEQGLRAGSIRGVVATNALELGIDIGQLGAAVIAGYPGTLASTWQQAGRAGRRAETGAAVIVMSGAPLDQYIAQHPRYLFEQPVENARINPDNLLILLNHVRCAAYELPFSVGEPFGAFGDISNLLDYLAHDEGVLHASAQGYRWIAPTPPAESVSLRTGGNQTIVIQDVSGAQPFVIGEVDRETAPVLVFPGAIYLHEGLQYAIEALDWDNGLASARLTEVDYYTEASGESTLQVLSEAASDVVGDLLKAHGLVEVNRQTTDYRVIKRYTHEVMGHGEIDLPIQHFETTAYWLALTPDLTAQLEKTGVLAKPNDYGPNWQVQRNAARTRDRFQCVRCGIPEAPDQQHHVHHLTPFYTFGYVRGVNTHYLRANQIENLQTLCASCHRIVETSHRTHGALNGAGNALRSVATLYLMCEPGDLGVIVEAKSDYTHAPTITLFDNLPAGLGFSDKLYELHPELMAAARDLVRDCACTEGCPACVGPSAASDSDTKALALHLLDVMQTS